MTSDGGGKVATESRVGGGTGRRLVLAAAAVVTLLLFLFAVRLLGAATEAAAPTLRTGFRSLVVGDAGALGASWLGTYLVTNGSVVEALSLSLLSADLVTGSQAFLMVAGSRLGAAAIVLLIGGLEYLRKPRFSLRRATGLGILTFLVTLSVYLPATLLGYLALPALRPRLAGVTDTLGIEFQPLTVFAGLVEGVLSVTGPLLGFGLALVLLFACIDLFDRLLSRVHTDTLRNQFFRRLRQRWVSFGIGLLVTSLTTSVAFSLGVIVPLYNREYVTRREIVRNIVGANVVTLVDTQIVAVVLGIEPGIAAVTTLIGTGLLVTLVVLAGFDPYYDGVTAVQDRLDDDRRLFGVFLAVLVAVPAALVGLAVLLP